MQHEIAEHLQSIIVCGLMVIIIIIKWNLCQLYTEQSHMEKQQWLIIVVLYVQMWPKSLVCQNKSRVTTPSHFLCNWEGLN